MIVRVVKMTFQKDQCAAFIMHFESIHKKIQSSRGCLYVHLLRDIQDKQVFFTYSLWTNDDALLEYRQSELFASAWSVVKPWFQSKPEAWSLQLLNSN